MTTKSIFPNLDAPPRDLINHPPHYKRGGVESLDVIEAWGLNFRLGNVVKYVCRAGHKGDVLADRIADLRKAEFYLRREIAALEQGQP